MTTRRPDGLVLSDPTLEEIAQGTLEPWLEGSMESQPTIDSCFDRWKGGPERTAQWSVILEARRGNGCLDSQESLNRRHSREDNKLSLKPREINVHCLPQDVILAE